MELCGQITVCDLWSNVTVAGALSELGWLRLEPGWQRLLLEHILDEGKPGLL